MKSILKFYKPYKIAIISGLILLMVRAAGELALPSYMAKIIDKGILKQNTDYIYSAGIRMLLIAILVSALTILVGYFAAKVSSGVGADLRGKIFSKVIRFGPAEMDRFNKASLITRSTNDVQQIQQATVVIMRMAAFAPILGLGALIKALQTNLGLGSTILVSLIAIVGLLVIIFITTIPKFQLIQTMLDNLNLVINERLSGNMVIRAFGKEKAEEERFQISNQAYKKLTLFINRAMSLMLPVLFFIMDITTMAVVWVGAKKVNIGDVQVGQIPAFIQYTSLVIISFLTITIIFIIVPRAMVSMRRISEVLDTEISVRDSLFSFDEKDPILVKNNSPALEFKSVYFKYPESQDYALENISFKAFKGTVTGIIGSTGSGKSTIINLIPRFYDPIQGEILLEGKEIKDLSLRQLRAQIGLVPQVTELFSGSILSNLTMGSSNLNEMTPAVSKALKVSQSWDFVMNKPEGINAQVSQGGKNFSGGQRQRLTIARALAKEPPILLLDDSFSSLDFRTDAHLRKQLKTEYKDAAILLVAQRINTIINADNIIVLDNGNIVGQGRHSELMNNCQVYREIAMSQLDPDEIKVATAKEVALYE